ncbi:hypothetical protein [Cerasicoccus frondis]|uniref:hypothetical protein n=1 Tax=Cerasicoccus frondis TaxID=490090 RepID=UPI0028529CCB|nr:hypothetical protein [Cerasicoccus frondis]
MNGNWIFLSEATPPDDLQTVTVARADGGVCEMRRYWKTWQARFEGLQGNGKVIAWQRLPLHPRDCPRI